jgi:hypothetical protein
MIRHSALFRLYHPSGSAAEGDFLRALSELESIPGVEAFQIARETSPKNPFVFAVAMNFEDLTAYSSYNNHPLHTLFVKERWIPEVAEFMEHDSEPLAPGCLY